MNTLLEILKIILPAIITGLFTFIVTKYTYRKNIPLDKLEFTYNRIYYPLYRLVNDKNINNDIDLIINRAKFYIDKYNKYVDISTAKSFDLLQESNTIAKKKAAFQNFKNNINDNNSYLRRRLGYLEPNILQRYTYLSESKKSTCRIGIDLFVIYICIVMVSTTKGNIQIFFITISLLFFIFIIFELIWKFFIFLYYKIRK